MCGSVHGRARSFLLLFTVLGDTYPQKHTVKHSVASSNTEKYNTFNKFSGPGPFFVRTKPPEAAAGHDTLVLRTEGGRPPLWTPLVEVSQPPGLSGPLCPAAASGGFVRLVVAVQPWCSCLRRFFQPKNWSRSEVGQKSQNVESSQNGLAYSGKS